MVLDARRKQANVILDPLAKLFIRTDPNLLSWISFLFAVLAGVLVAVSGISYLLILPLVSIAVLVSGMLDAIDGKVARLTGKASNKGDFVDHVLDRYSDIFMIGGITLSVWCNPYIGFLALTGVMLTSYMGTQAQAIGAGRLYAGLLGRADRMVLLIAAPLAQMALTANGMSWISIGVVQLSPFEIAMLWFGVVGNITAIQRAWATWKRLR